MSPRIVSFGRCSAPVAADIWLPVTAAPLPATSGMAAVEASVSRNCRRFMVSSPLASGFPRTEDSTNAGQGARGHPKGTSEAGMTTCSVAWAGKVAPADSGSGYSRPVAGRRRSSSFVPVLWTGARPAGNISNRQKKQECRNALADPPLLRM